MYLNKRLCVSQRLSSTTNRMLSEPTKQKDEIDNHFSCSLFYSLLSLSFFREKILVITDNMH
jgi:hypothetical protein